MNKVVATIETINSGAIVDDVNLGIESAARRLEKSGLAQKVCLTIDVKPSDVSDDIVQVGHKVEVKSASPKPAASYAFIGQGGRLEVDQEIDESDPTLSQKVLPLQGKG